MDGSIFAIYFIIDIIYVSVFLQFCRSWQDVPGFGRLQIFVITSTNHRFAYFCDYIIVSMVLKGMVANYLNVNEILLNLCYCKGIFSSNFVQFGLI